jgi:hypothetical protein
VKTSSFWLYTGPGRISIARGARRVPGGFRVCKALAPGPWFKSVDEATYRRLYFDELLGRLDPAETWETLHRLAGEAAPVLMCWETLLRPGEWCHRRLVAEWFRDRLGYVVDELVA